MQAARIHEDLTLRLDDVDVPRPGRGGVWFGSTPQASAAPTSTSWMA